MDRASFYEWKRRLQTQGFEGLKDLPPIHKSHPQTTPPETVEKIKAHPAYGCNRHEAMLALEGIWLSAITIQKILNEHGLGTKIERWLALEKAVLTDNGREFCGTEKHPYELYLGLNGI